MVEMKVESLRLFGGGWRMGSGLSFTFFALDWLGEYDSFFPKWLYFHRQSDDICRVQNSLWKMSGLPTFSLVCFGMR